MIVLALQFFEGDKAQAMRLARLIADIEPEFRHDVEMCFVARFDTSFDAETMAYVSKKFYISHYQTTTRLTGWPIGANAAAIDFINEANRRSNMEWENATGILLLEPDTVPLCRDWLNKLIKAWNHANSLGCWCMGSFRQAGPRCGHINGVMVIRPDFANLFTMPNNPIHEGWDCYIAPQTVNHWHVSGLFLNKWHENSATFQSLRTPETGNEQPVLVHGYKDDSAYNIAKTWMHL